MQGIEFEEDNSYQIKDVIAKQSLMKSILSKIGISDPMTINYILTGIAVIFFGITIFMYADILSNESDMILTSSLE